jgi:hypothetical protein
MNAYTPVCISWYMLLLVLLVLPILWCVSVCIRYARKYTSVCIGDESIRLSGMTFYTIGRYITSFLRSACLPWDMILNIPDDEILKVGLSFAMLSGLCLISCSHHALVRFGIGLLSLGGAIWFLISVSQGMVGIALLCGGLTFMALALGVRLYEAYHAPGCIDL